MAISHVGTTTASHPSSTVTLSCHASTQIGDIVIAIGVRDEGYATAGWTGNPFTLLRTLDAGTSTTTGGRIQIWALQATANGAVSYSYTDSGNNSTGCVHLITVRGADMPTATNTASQNNTTSSTTPPSPTVGSGTLDMLITAWGVRVNGSTRTFGVGSSGLTTLGQVTDSTNYYASFAAYGLAVAAGSKSVSLSPTSTTRAAAIYLTASSTSVPKSGSDSGTGSESGSVSASTSGTDSGTGSESGFVSLLKSGTDTATGSESGFVAQLNDGSDSGTGSSSVASLAASTSGSDTATGTGTVVALSAATSGSDTGIGSSSGYITLPGSDTATGAAALVALNASTSGGDTGVGSEGGYIEELFGNLVIALWAVDPDDGTLTPLPDHQSFTMSRERNGAGSISLTYPVDGQNFNILRDTITSDRDLEVEIWTIGQKTGAMRGFLQEASGDDVKEDRTWTFAGGFAELLIGEAIAWPAPIITITTVVTTTKLGESNYQIVTKTTTASSAGGPPVTTTVTTTATSGTEGTTTSSQSTKGDLEFEAVTPGELALFLVDQAQDRGGLDGLTVGFTATHDSAGVAWPDLITSKFSPGSTYDSMLNRLVDFGLAEWGVTWTGTSYRLDLWVIFGRGVDRTTGPRPIVLRRARNLLDAPRKWTVRDAGTTVLAAGAEGVYESASDADALARRGRRIERSASANNLSDADAVQGFAQNQLHLMAVGRLQIDHGIGFLPGEPRPVIAFDIGDWIYSETSVGLERLRVVQWTLSVNNDQPSGTVTLNDTITDALSRLQALLDNLTSGDTVVGTSTSSGGQDHSTPLPPEVLSASSIAFLDGTLGVRAAVTVAFDPPVLNTDGTVITDMDHFNVQFALATAPDVWNAGITVGSNESDATFVAPAGQTITIRVNAVDRQGNTSVWSDPPYPHTTSNDDIPPPVPSAATVSEFLGTIRITWDGLTFDSAVMYEAAIDFDHVEVHLSTGSLFTPSDSTLVGRLFGRGTYTVTDLPYGVTQFARFVAVDWSGNKSDPSGQGSATPAQIVNIDVGPDAIDRTQIIDGEIVNALIANATIQDAKIANLNVGKLIAGTLTADITLSSIIRTATSGNRTEMDSAGIRLYNGSNVVVDFKTSNGSALVVGEFRTSLTGQRIVFNPGGALADTMNFYPSAAGDFARIMARTAPADGSAAILIDGGAANGQPRGRVGAYKSEAFISYVTNDSGGDTSAGFSRTAVSSQTNNIVSWVQTLFAIDHYSGSSVIGGSRIQAFWVSGSVSNCGAITQPGQDAGLRFDDGALNATKGNGTTPAPMVASSFPITSTRTVKTDEAGIGVDTTELVRRVDSKQWRYRFEVDEDPAAPLHFGPIAEDVAEYMPGLLTTAMGMPALDLRDEFGVLWDVAQKLIRRVDALEGRDG